jgi:hypothetical protein
MKESCVYGSTSGTLDLNRYTIVLQRLEICWDEPN